MYEAKIVNGSGEELVLTGREPEYQITSITGLDPPEVTLNTTTIVGMDGALFNSSRINTRNIVITMRINGDAERNRNRLYAYFREKDRLRFFFANGRVSVYIDGYLNKFDVNMFQKGQTAQISIICPSPYFIDTTEIVSDISNTVGLFTFPFSINEDEPIPISDYSAERISDVLNESQIETGFKIAASFSGAVSKLKIADLTTGETFTLNKSFQSGDLVEINTTKGHKSITLTRAGVSTSIFSSMAKGSTFFQLRPGVNRFEFEADNGTRDDLVTILFYRSTEYLGV